MGFVQTLYFDVGYEVQKKNHFRDDTEMVR